MTIPLESSKQTSENLEIKLTPDDLIKKLESAALNTVDQKEKDGHKKVIARIKELQSGTNGVAENWWKKLRDQLSDADKNLASKVSESEDITKKLGIETALVALKQGADASVKSASEKVEQAKKAIEKGDIGATVVAAGAIVTEKTGGIMKKFSEAKGLEKLDVIREAGATVMEKVGQFFALLFSFLSFDSSKIKDAWNNLIGVPKDVADAMGKGKEIVESGTGNKVLKPIEEAYAKVREAQKSKNPQLIAVAVKEYREAKEKIKDIPLPENQKKWMADVEGTIGGIEKTVKETLEKFKETNLPKFTKYISDEFYGGAKLPDHMLKDIEKAFNNVHYGQDTIDEISKRMDDKNNTDLAKTHDVGKFLAEIILKNKESLFILLSVIPVKRWAWNITKKTVAEGANAYWMNVSLIFGDGTSSMPVEFGKPELMNFIEKSKSDDLRRNILLMQFYRVNGVFATMLGAGVAGVWGGVNMLLDNSHKVDGIKTFTHTWQKNYSALADDIGELEKAFGGATKFKMADLMRNSLQSIRQNFLLLNFLEEGKKDPVLLKKLLKTENYKELTTVFKLSAEKIDQNAKNLGPFLGSLMTVNTDTSKFLTSGSKMIATDTGVAQEFLEKCTSIQGFQRRLATRSWGEFIKNFGGSFEILSFPRYADRVLLRFKNMETAEKTLRQLSSYGGQTLGGLLKGLPVAGLVVGGVSLANRDMKTDEKAINFGKLAAQTLVPVIGPISLFFDDEIGMKINKETYEIENLGIGMVALGTATFEGVMLTKAFGKGGLAGAGKYMMGPLTDAAHLTKTVFTGGRAIAKATPRIVNPKWIVEGVEVFGKVPRYGKYIASFLLMAGGTYMYMKSNEDMEETLAKEGLWDKKTGNLTPKALQEFAKMDDMKKKEFCDTLLHQFVEKGGNTKLPNSKSHIENGVYSIVVDTPAEQKIWTEAILAKKDLFGNELARLQIDVDILDVETIKKAQEKIKMA